MKAYITFTRKIEDKLHVIGLNNNITDLENGICKLISGQPVICICDDKNITALYSITENGEINQCFGNNDLLFEIKTIKDISLININKYNTIKHYLISSFCCLSIKELSIYEKELNHLEDKIFYNLLHTEIEIEKLKSYILKEFNKYQIKYEIKQRLLKQLKNTKMPPKKNLKKKIDVNLFGYDIHINTLV